MYCMLVRWETALDCLDITSSHVPQEQITSNILYYTIMCRMYENYPASQFEMHAQGRTDTVQALVQYVLLTIQ